MYVEKVKRAVVGKNITFSDIPLYGLTVSIHSFHVKKIYFEIAIEKGTLKTVSFPWFQQQAMLNNMNIDEL